MVESYFFESKENVKDNRVYVLIIYDIIDNKRRLKLAKYLNGYGFRVQKSCFEAKISKNKYEKMINGIGNYATTEDSIRVYKIIGSGQVSVFGKKFDINDEEVIVI